MNRIYKLGLIMLIASLIYPHICYGAWVWTPETGSWINPKSAVKDTAEQQFKWAMEFYEAKDYKRAVSEFERLVKFYPNSTYAPQAQYYAGRAYEDMEEYYHAYLSYQKVIEAYPYAKNRDEIIKRQYDIGLLFFNGQRAKILGVALLPAIDKSIEIFEEVVKNSPYGEYADRAQFKIGEAYKNSNRFAEAIVAFQRVVDEYPKSELSNEAEYEVAQCAYLASSGSSYDQESTDIAIERFEEFVKEEKEDSLSKEAETSLERLREKKAKGLYDTAHFYERIGHNQSAAIYYKELIDEYPDTSLAKESIAKLVEMEKRLSRSYKR